MGEHSEGEKLEGDIDFSAKRDVNYMGRVEQQEARQACRAPSRGRTPDPMQKTSCMQTRRTSQVSTWATHDSRICSMAVTAEAGAHTPAGSRRASCNPLQQPHFVPMRGCPTFSAVRQIAPR